MLLIIFIMIKDLGFSRSAPPPSHCSNKGSKRRKTEGMFYAPIDRWHYNPPSNGLSADVLLVTHDLTCVAINSKFNETFNVTEYTLLLGPAGKATDFRQNNLHVKRSHTVTFVTISVNYTLVLVMGLRTRTHFETFVNWTSIAKLRNWGTVLLQLMISEFLSFKWRWCNSSLFS